MKRIRTYDEWIQAITKDTYLLLFVETDNCSVCHGLRPQVEDLQKEYQMPFYIVNASSVREMTGQLSLFSAPVVLLYANEKEYARFARFVPMQELKQRMNELVDRGQEE